MGIYEYDAELHDKVLKEESWEEGLKEGLIRGKAEGRAEGKTFALVQMVCRKLERGKAMEMIAEELEEDVGVITEICAVALKYAPDFDAEKILEEFNLFSKKGHFAKIS